MLKNYWLIAWRTIVRNKLHTTINILGLALGICGCLVLYLITDYEFSFDRHRPDRDRIYRIVGNRTAPDGGEGFLNSPNDDIAGFQTQIPGFESSAGLFGYQGKISVPQSGQPARNSRTILRAPCTRPAPFLPGPAFFPYSPTSGWRAMRAPWMRQTISC